MKPEAYEIKTKSGGYTVSAAYSESSFMIKDWNFPFFSHHSTGMFASKQTWESHVPGRHTLVHRSEKRKR